MSILKLNETGKS